MTGKAAPGHRRVTRLLFCVASLIVLCLTGCTYPTHRWSNFKKYIKKSIETPLTPEGRCEKRGGLPYGQNCYEASYEAFGEQDCRLRGGLYYAEECYFPEDNRIIVE